MSKNVYTIQHTDHTSREKVGNVLIGSTSETINDAKTSYKFYHKDFLGTYIEQTKE